MSPEPNDRPDELTPETEHALRERLCSLIDQLGSGLSAAEFVQRVVALLGDGSRESVGQAFLVVLIRYGCSDVLLDEIRHILESGRPTKTVKKAARHAKKDPGTLRRHWRSLCAGRDLHDLIQLTQLVHLARGTGSARKRALADGIDIRTARVAALKLTERSLDDLLSEPIEIVNVLNRWLRPPAALLP